LQVFTFGFIDVPDFIVNIFGDSEIKQPTTLPTTKTSCNDYHISNEIRAAFGNPAINNVETWCNALSGIWTENPNEMTCWWNPIVEPTVCDEDSEEILKAFCQDTLKATWTCNKFDAFIGCQCNRQPDGQWEEQDDENPDEGDGNTKITCDGVILPEYGDLGAICREEGQCTDMNCDHYWWYDQQIHKCGCTETTFCGQYCYEYLVH